MGRLDMGKYFLNTYALMEYLAGNKAYLKYFSSDNEQKTSILNLMDLYFHVLQDAGEDSAEDSYVQFKQLVVPLKDDDVKDAMKFRLRSGALTFHTQMRWGMHCPRVRVSNF